MFNLDARGVLNDINENYKDSFMQTNITPVPNEKRREIGDEAAWQLSSAKTGNGVDQLRDDSTNTFWQ